MTKPILGAKRKCLNCGTAFFDLEHDPIICPRCQAVFTPPPVEPARPIYARRSRIRAEPVRAAEPEPATEEELEASVEDDPDAAEPAGEPDDDILPLES
jgi:uncharacterized protein (TIGR02300 family)